MPKNKNAYLRYRVIDNCLNNTMRNYTKDDLKREIYLKSDINISIDMLSKWVSGNQPGGFGDALYDLKGTATGAARDLRLTLLADTVDEVDDLAVEGIGFAK